MPADDPSTEPSGPSPSSRPRRRALFAGLTVAVVAVAVLGLGLSDTVPGFHLSASPSSKPSPSPAPPVPSEYLLTFTETGLPAGTSWSVVVGDSTNSSVGISIGVKEVNGSYSYSIAPVGRYTASPNSGTVTVSGAPVTIASTFSLPPPKPASFPVNFTEVGLPPGTEWNVTVEGVRHTSMTAYVNLSFENGSYPFSVETPAAGWNASPVSGSVTVAGRPVQVNVSFTSTAPQNTLILGGSTSVYPFAALAVDWFEQNNSDDVIEVDQGGTGAGMLALCAGQIDVGMASTPETPTILESEYGCPSSPGITITTVAYDAVDIVVGGNNTHGLLSLNWDTLAWIYEQGSTSTPTLAHPVTFNTVATGSILGWAAPTQGTEFGWDQIPAAVNGATIGALGTEQVESAGVGAGGAACAAPFADDICAATFGTTVTPCGFSVCAGGAALVVPVDRSDASGTTQTFEAKLLGAINATDFAANFSSLGYTGCGPSSLLSDCGITLPSDEEAIGNPGMLSYVAGNANAIGYASDGLARLTVGIGASGLIPFDAIGQAGNLSQTSGANFAYGAVVPTLGTNGTIAGGISASPTLNNYAGWRPFEFVTLHPPTGVAQRLFEFILDPANNLTLAAAVAEVSIYSV